MSCLRHSRPPPQVVADKLRVCVSWHALGKTGADVSTIRESLVRSEALRRVVVC